MPTRRPLLAVALVATLFLPAVSGCLGGSRETLIVAASAPRVASGMTVFVVSDRVLDRLADGARAQYAIHYGDRIIYPPGGHGAEIKLDGRTGSTFIPYDRFVVGNGEYDVVVRLGSQESRTRVSVHKWVDYVFLHPFDQGSNVRVEVALSSGTGGNPSDRVLAVGDLVLGLHYRGLDGAQDRMVTTLKAKTRNDASVTAITLARSQFTQGPGYYSFEPLFHNEEARNNLQVKADPTMANRNPPWNWVYIR